METRKRGRRGSRRNCPRGWRYFRRQAHPTATPTCAPYVRYDITDRWRIDGGANIFLGDDRHTQFGQLDRNSNVYFDVRYSF